MLNIPLFAILNRARGSHFGELVPSTGFCHIFAPLLMSLMLATSPESLLIIWACLVFWCIWAWDAYWGACMGNKNDRTRPAVAWIDTILKRFNFKNIRVHGIVGMGLRQGVYSLPLMLYLKLPIYLYLIPFLFGLPYWLFSLISMNFVMYSELTIGAIWGLIL